MDLTGFRGAFEYLMTDKMTVKRTVPDTEDEYGFVVTGGTKTIHDNIKCRVSKEGYTTSMGNPNAENKDSIPVLYKLRVFAPYNTDVKAGDLITLTRKVGGVEKVYKDKQATEVMLYDNDVEFSIGIDEEA